MRARARARVRVRVRVRVIRTEVVEDEKEEEHISGRFHANQEPFNNNAKLWKVTRYTKDLKAIHGGE